MTAIATLIETYQELPIAFRASDGWVNITSMCKVFGKEARRFMALPETKRYIETLEKEITGVCSSAFDAAKSGDNTDFDAAKCGVYTVSKGQNRATWAHPDLAIECARWISPEFAIWCNRTVRKILAGVTVATGAGWSLEAVLSADNARKVAEIQDLLFEALKKLTANQLTASQASAIVALCSQWLRAWQLALETWKQGSGGTLQLPAAPVA